MTAGIYRESCCGKENGFTLVELLVVVAIIAVLAAIAIPQFTKHLLKSSKAELDSDARNIYIAAQAYLSSNSVSNVDSLGKLAAGGYIKSPHVVFVNANMGQAVGKVEIYSDTLKSRGKDNNSVIFSNGRVEFANAP